MNEMHGTELLQRQWPEYCPVEVSIRGQRFLLPTDAQEDRF